MITIQVKKDYQWYYLAVVHSIQEALGKKYYHFLFEPELVIRIEEKDKDKVVRILKDWKLKYKIYPYPLGRPFGEGKRSVVYKYQQEFKDIMGGNSKLAIKSEKKEKNLIIERVTHTMMNTFGYEWEDEVLIYLALARGRVRVIRKYNTKYLFEKIWCSITIFTIKIAILFAKGLKYDK